MNEELIMRLKDILISLDESYWEMPEREALESKANALSESMTHEELVETYARRESFWLSYEEQVIQDCNDRAPEYLRLHRHTGTPVLVLSQRRTIDGHRKEVRHSWTPLKDARGVDDLVCVAWSMIAAGHKGICLRVERKDVHYVEPFVPLGWVGGMNKIKGLGA